MSAAANNRSVVAKLLLAMFFWGGSNTGTKYLLGAWPPFFTGFTRFAFAGLILLALFRWTKWLGPRHDLSPALRRELWWRGGLSLALFVTAFNLALLYTTASHLTLYIGSSPIWALLWEGVPERSWRSVRRYGAALLALSGVVVLMWPALHTGHSQLLGEVLAFAAGLFWTNYGIQCRHFTRSLAPLEITAHNFIRAGVFFVPFMVWELLLKPLPLHADLIGVQGFCILAGSILGYGLWNSTLRDWPASQVYLFNNLIPISTVLWSHFCLGEPITSTFWLAMGLVGAGVCLAQWEGFKARPAPAATVPPDP